MRATPGNDVRAMSSAFAVSFNHQQPARCHDEMVGLIENEQLAPTASSQNADDNINDATDHNHPAQGLRSAKRFAIAKGGPDQHRPKLKRKHPSTRPMGPRKDPRKALTQRLISFSLSQRNSAYKGRHPPKKADTTHESKNKNRFVNTR